MSEAEALDRTTVMESVPMPSAPDLVAVANETLGTGSSSSRMVTPMVSAGSPVLNLALVGLSRMIEKARVPEYTVSS
jgi:hypothetical protein